MNDSNQRTYKCILGTNELMNDSNLRMNAVNQTMKANINQRNDKW